MSRLTLVREPTTGKLIATADGAPIYGAIVKSIDAFNDIGMGVTVIVPLKDAVVKEQDNILPLRATR